ncbi:MAG: DsbA family protein [Anaerolineae bacterium]|nr:DsbA family protein [Anaerolineales bacterium]MCQ3978642.1 DsbA family protein [Anaerolineae bacterium]
MKIIYVMDPLCGWCYGNSQTISQVYEQYNSDFEFDLLPGGMFAGRNAQVQGRMAGYIRQHDRHIQTTTGAVFGEAYFTSLDNPALLLDSEPPSRAIVTVRTLWPDQLFPFAAQVQAARFQQGKNLNEAETYAGICQVLGLDKETFLSHFSSEEMKRLTQETFRQAATYAQAYPTLLLENGRSLQLLSSGYTPAKALVQKISSIKILSS